MLTYGYHFEVCAIEAQPQLITLAGDLDNQFHHVFQKKYGYRKRTSHVNMRIEPDITSKEFLNIIKSSFDIDNDDFEFGLVGLHPCGDLGPTLLRLFNEISNIKYINIVGCCYMKLSTNRCLNVGFPLSKFCKNNNYQLCYNSREIACHAIENYIMKLNEGEYWKLKIHAYRATIEKILIEMDSQYKHIPLANVKYSIDLDFGSYCKKATSKLFGDIIETATIKSNEIENCLKQWNSVVIFYSFRLFFAPLIESSFYMIDICTYKNKEMK
ncbi:hypothetical protein HHI36_023323 [Cryptolaemus montrouzieri]|uniref:Methyltransferase domain-containing protein n=1 Tax=Cryptolaemus montrouzieri TaxID=559131 RepID=A0ABD2PHQ1_9CUCU